MTNTQRAEQIGDVSEASDGLNLFRRIYLLPEGTREHDIALTEYAFSRGMNLEQAQRYLRTYKQSIKA